MTRPILIVSVNVTSPEQVLSFDCRSASEAKCLGKSTTQTPEWLMIEQQQKHINTLCKSYMIYFTQCKVPIDGKHAMCIDACNR